MSEQGPAGWKLMRLGDVTDVVRGITFPASAKVERGASDVAACLRTSNVQTVLGLDDLLYVPKSYVKRSDQWVQPGDIVMSMANSANLVGKVALATDNLPPHLTFGGFLSVFRPRGISGAYLFQFLRSPATQAALRASASQTTNIANLSVKRIAELEIPVPPPAQQQRVVELISRRRTRTDASRRALDAVPPLLEKLRQSILAAAFRGDLTKDWRAKHHSLSSIARFIDYRGRTPTKTQSGIPLITAKNVRRGAIVPTPHEYIAAEDYDAWMTRGIPRPGDVLITTEAPLGNVACVERTDRFALAQRVICLQVDQSLVFGPYLAIAMQSPTFQALLTVRATGTTVSGIKASRLKLLEVPLPSVAEQKRVADQVQTLLRRVAAAEARVSTQLNRLIELERATMAATFSGVPLRA